MTVSQTFVMTAPTFHAIEFRPAPPDHPVSGSVRLELHDLTGHGDRVVRAVDVPAATVAAAPTYRFEFEPVNGSKDAPYRFDVTSPAPTGLTLWATRGEGYPEGALAINDISRWADLAFEVDAPVPTRWSAIVELPFPRNYAVAGALVAEWLLVGVAFVLIARAFARQVACA